MTEVFVPLREVFSPDCLESIVRCSDGEHWIITARGRDEDQFITRHVKLDGRVVDHESYDDVADAFRHGEVVRIELGPGEMRTKPLDRSTDGDGLLSVVGDTVEQMLARRRQHLRYAETALLLARFGSLELQSRDVPAPVRSVDRALQAVRTAMAERVEDLKMADDDARR